MLADHYKRKDRHFNREEFFKSCGLSEEDFKVNIEKESKAKSCPKCGGNIFRDTGVRIICENCQEWVR